ncbi:MAG: twin-arginine translocase subunit TatC [Alphaproteobacteria bacterium]|nr:twin-arginine translocase subunit TatC [Alphaproteobacteria bacterium]MBQ9235243.1 twin-arginine translocase subunit TatC [Alphaproteobacteria bacterium]
MNDDSNQSLIAHLEALRTVLLRSFVALGAVLLPCFWAAPYVIDWLIKVMLDGENISLNYFSPMEVFILQIKTALVVDILLCFPYIAKQIWNFVLPALYDNERRFIRSIVLASGILFATGVLFCVFFILPLIIKFGLSFISDNITPVFGISNVITLALWLGVVFGLCFQFPLVTYALIVNDIVSYATLRSKRPYIFVGVLALSALLTPPDIVSQLMLTAPTYGLFEIGLYFGRLRKSEKNS